MSCSWAHLSGSTAGAPAASSRSHRSATGSGWTTSRSRDHPYQPALLDTWTLLSYVAARTETIHIAPNVIDLPLRPPAVLARSVASLDRLSGGRIELGLGTGGFWDAIAAIGGRRLSPAEAVRALEEAIAIIRGIWETGERGMLRVDGELCSPTGTRSSIRCWTISSARSWRTSAAHTTPGHCAPPSTSSPMRRCRILPTKSTSWSNPWTRYGFYPGQLD